MKRILLLMFASGLIMYLLSGCSGKSKIVPVEGLDTYNDPVMNFSIKYPKNWSSQRYQGERFVVYTSKEVIKRFNFATTAFAEGEIGARISFQVIKIQPELPFDTIITRKDFLDTIYSKPTKVKIDGIEALKFTYSFEVNDGPFQGEVYYATKDNQVASIIKFEAFGGTLEGYRNTFNDILNSIKLAESQKSGGDTITKIIERPLPSQNLVQTKGEGFTIMIPDNFDLKKPRIGGVQQSFQYIGERRADCDIRVDIIDASKQNKLETIAEQMKPSHKNANPVPSSIGGLKSMMFSYSPIAGVQSRVHYAVKGNTLYRVTMNWATAEEKDYKPILEKSLNSIKFN